MKKMAGQELLASPMRVALNGSLSLEGYSAFSVDWLKGFWVALTSDLNEVNFSCTGGGETNIHVFENGGRRRLRFTKLLIGDHNGRWRGFLCPHIRVGFRMCSMTTEIMKLL
jgi:hypothetical protein